MKGVSDRLLIGVGLALNLVSLERIWIFLSLTELGSDKFEFSACLIFPALFIFKLDIANSFFL